jgi:hypothetical protein
MCPLRTPKEYTWMTSFGQELTIRNNFLTSGSGTQRSPSPQKRHLGIATI